MTIIEGVLQLILQEVNLSDKTARRTGLLSALSSQLISPLPFAFGYWKIMIIFSTSGTLRNILQNNSSKTFSKHNLLFSNITIMKWIHGIQC